MRISFFPLPGKGFSVPLDAELLHRRKGEIVTHAWSWKASKLHPHSWQKLTWDTVLDKKLRRLKVKKGKFSVPRPTNNFLPLHSAWHFFKSVRHFVRSGWRFVRFVRRFVNAVW